MTLSQIRAILQTGGIRLSRSLGQNFLHDQNQLERILGAADLSSEDRVLEIGPGLGALTSRLVAKAGEVLAVEKDRRLHDWLANHLASKQGLKLVHADALEYIRQNTRSWAGWKLVSNLPYSVGSPIMVALAQTPEPPSRMVVTVQLEVALRLTAQPGSGEYGLLTLLMGLRYESVKMFRISGGCFFPAPKVDSSCITLLRRAKPLLPATESSIFDKIVHQAFSQRRKMMLKLLRQKWPDRPWDAWLSALNVRPAQRAEEISLDSFVQLTKLAAQAPTEL